ncbi:MAG: NAD(P)-binding protein, partial [Steroidobacteraceae bacterium]
MTSDSCEVAIVGGGPAGLAAAAAMKACGLDVWLIDEQPRLGGQIYRQPPADFQVDSWLTGRIYERGKALLERVERFADLRRVAPATVCGLFPAESIAEGGCHRILYERDGKLGRLEAPHVLLATGCYEMPVPFPGWQLPGVMSVGGIQTLLKSQRVAA